MQILKGTKLLVNHQRHGTYYGIASKNFDTEKEIFYPIELNQPMLSGMNTNWVKGDIVPCRNILCTLKVIEERNVKNVRE